MDFLKPKFTIVAPATLHVMAIINPQQHNRKNCDLAHVWSKRPQMNMHSILNQQVL